MIGALARVAGVPHQIWKDPALMREYDEEDPRKPQPVRIVKKRTNPNEAAEFILPRKDDDRDRHRHVV